jgi:hypothetical protein
MNSQQNIKFVESLAAVVCIGRFNTIMSVCYPRSVSVGFIFISHNKQRLFPHKARNNAELNFTL